MKTRLLYTFSLILINLFAAGQVVLTNVRDLAMGNASIANLPSYGASKNIAFIPKEGKSFLCFGIANNYLIKDLSPAFISFIKSFGETTSAQLSAVRMGNNFFFRAIYSGRDC